MITEIKVGVLLIGASALFGSGWFLGHHIDHAQWEAKWQARDAADATAAARNAEAIVQNERKNSAAMSALDNSFTLEKADNEKKNVATLGAITDGTLQLLPRFSCSAPAAVVSATRSSASEHHAASATGLRGADAVFLVRLSQRADEAARQLTACQAVLSQERATDEKKISEKRKKMMSRG